MVKPGFKKILDHIDREEIINKLILGISPADIHDWLKAKYTNVSEDKFVIAEKTLKSFKDNHLDIYTTIRDDFAKGKAALATTSSSIDEELELSIKNNQNYKNLVLKTVSQELDLKETLQRLCSAVETRLGQIYDVIQEDPRNINTRVDRLFTEYVNALGGILEKAYKIINNGPDQVVQHNVMHYQVDQQVAVFYEAIKETLEQMDLESSMFFMEKFNEKITKLQEVSPKSIQPVEQRMAEVKLINSQINEKIRQEI